MSLFTKTIITEIITLLLVMLFLYTGISKLSNYSLFKEQISTSPLLVSLARYIALALPWIEFAIVLILVIPRYRFFGLITSLILMFIFTAYVVCILLFNETLPCSCGGVLEEMSWQQHVVFNFTFTALTLVGIILQKQIIRAKRNHSTRAESLSTPINAV